MTFRLAVALIGLLAAAPASAGEREIEVPGPEGPLKGVLTQPATPTRPPVVLVIPGSGPTDRDGNNSYGIKAAPYRLLARALERRGIATLRIDKRGLFSSRAAIADANAVRLSDYVDDVGAWTTALRREAGAECVWLLGHSEGGLIALLAANQMSGLCGLLLVATPGRPMGDILREQLGRDPANAPLLAQAMWAIEALEAGREVDDADLHPALRPLFAKPVQGFLIDLLARDPADLAARLSLPMLIVQGRRDLQVGEVDAARLKAARPGPHLVFIDDMNHVLKPVPPTGGRQANLAAYADPDLPLADGLAGALADFIDASRSAGSK